MNKFKNKKEITHFEGGEIQLPWKRQVLKRRCEAARGRGIGGSEWTERRKRIRMFSLSKVLLLRFESPGAHIMSHLIKWPSISSVPIRSAQQYHLEGLKCSYFHCIRAYPFSYAGTSVNSHPPIVPWFNDKEISDLLLLCQIISDTVLHHFITALGLMMDT